ncbi:MAG: response regulator [Polyangiaceae bacterium]|jgi:CheY-like chemotaxis protein
MPSIHSTTRSATRVRRPGRILVVDDEASLGEALQRLLSDENEVVVVHDATSALARLAGGKRGERFDVVLCDLMMPIMDGIELHRRLSLTCPEEAERMVFMTGGAMTARVEAFFRRVPNLLLDKPIDLDGLHALIERRVGAPFLAASA